MVTTPSRTGTRRLVKGRAIQLLIGLLMAFVAISATPVPESAQASTLQASSLQASSLPASSVQASSVQVQVAAQPARIQTQASWTCNWSRSGNNVDSYCSVYSGYLRQWAYCGGWGYIYTGWVGAGYWHLWTHCNAYPLIAWGYQSVG